MSDVSTRTATKRAVRNWPRRILFHHVPLALVSTLVLLVFMSLPMFTTGGGPVDIFSGPLPQSPDGTGGMNHGGGEQAGHSGRSTMSLLTTATGYVATGLLALTLLIGPMNLLLRRRNPVSGYLRRDAGIWTVVFSVVHVVLGLQVHGDASDAGNFVTFFATANSFGLANWLGLAALVIAAGLLAISTDRALRELKARRWKDLQRLNYTLFALVVLHAYFYGAFVRPTAPFTLVLFGIVAVVAVGQSTGIWLWRRRNARHSADAPVT
jgi:methionine sulfoxide reductase heme-binding subunit